MARPIMRRKEEPFDLVPANDVTRLDDRLELVYFEKDGDGGFTIYEEDPGSSPPPQRAPRKRKAKAIPDVVVSDSTEELDELMAGLEIGENSE